MFLRLRKLLRLNVNGESRHKANGMEKKHSLSSNNLLTLSPTGSDLTRKDSFQRMVVIQEYVPKDCTGVAVRRGQTVELVGGDGEWLFVKTDRGEEGYVPRSHCVYPYSASRPEREGDMDFRPQLDNRSRSFSGMQGENNIELIQKMKEHSPNGIAKTRVLSPGIASAHNKNANNTNTTTELSGLPGSAPHSPNSSIERNTSHNILVNGKRFSDHSSSSGHYDASDSSADERTVSPEHSNSRSDTTSGDGTFVSNALKNKMASESDLLTIKDRPLPATPAKSKQPVHFYHIITDFPSSRKEAEVADNECPYSNPLDAIAPNQPSWGDKRWLGSGSDLIRPSGSRQREGTPEWKPPLPSRAPLQGSNDTHCLSTGSNTGSQRSITGSTDGSFCAEQQKENQNNKVYKFRKFIWGVYVIQQDFEAIDENEISVRTGQHVSLLNQDDADWYWVVRHDDSQEGFVPRSHLLELMHVEQPYSAVTGKPLVNGLKQHGNNDGRSHRSGSDGGRATPTNSVASDNKSGPRFARSHSGSPSYRVMPPSNNRNRQRNQVNGPSTSPAPPQPSEKESSHRLKVNEGVQMRNSSAKKDTAKSPEAHNSSAQSESGESSIVGTLV